jgi:hypothetical protein
MTSRLAWNFIHRYRMMKQKIFKAFMPVVVCLMVSGWGFAIDSHAPMDEIRDVLRTRLYPPPEETKLQALTLDHLAQDLKNIPDLIHGSMRISGKNPP